MTDLLDPTECRILGVLIEKELTTPDAYPLSVNSVVNGCNQKSARWPVTESRDFEIDGALQSLFAKRWAAPADTGGRVPRWRHRVGEKLTLTRPELAVLAELLLRGPQQPGELRTHAERMAAIPTAEDLQNIIDRMGKMLPPLVVRLPRVPGERADRHGHTLGGAPGVGTAASPAQPAGTSPAAPAFTVPGRLPVAAPAAAVDLPALLARVDQLEAEVAKLREVLDAWRRSDAH